MAHTPNFWSLIYFLHAFLTDVDFRELKISKGKEKKKNNLFSMLIFIHSKDEFDEFEEFVLLINISTASSLERKSTRPVFRTDL